MVFSLGCIDPHLIPHLHPRLRFRNGADARLATYLHHNIYYIALAQISAWYSHTSFTYTQFDLGDRFHASASRVNIHEFHHASLCQTLERSPTSRTSSSVPALPVYNPATQRLHTRYVYYTYIVICQKYRAHTEDIQKYILSIRKNLSTKYNTACRTRF